MGSPDQVRDDLQFLRGAVERQQRRFQIAVGPSVAVIWATYILVISVVNDSLVWQYTAGWARYVGWFGGVLAIVASAVVPWYESRRRGEIARVTSRDVARRLLPWLGCAAAVALFLGVAESLGLYQRFWIVMLMIALTAFHVGLAGSSVMLWMAIGAAAGMGTKLLMPPLGWIGFALPFFAAVVYGAWIEARVGRR